MPSFEVMDEICKSLLPQSQGKIFSPVKGINPFGVEKRLALEV